MTWAERGVGAACLVACRARRPSRGSCSIAPRAPRRPSPRLRATYDDVVAGLGEHLDDAGAIVPEPTTPTVGPAQRACGSPAAARGVSASSTTCELPGLGVGVEAAAALATLEAGADHLLDDRARRVQPVAALLVHRVEDLVGGVETDEVHQGERAHRVAAAELHRGVDVLAGGVARLEHRDGVVEVAEEQGVGDEAGLVADDDRLLAEPLGERLDVLEDLVLGDDGADHLDELQHRRRVEEVHADDALGVARGDGDLGHRQRATCWSRGSRRGHDGVELARRCPS